MSKTKHAEGKCDFALCGLAADAFESGDEEEPVVFARAGEIVTCTDCRWVIDQVRGKFKGYRYTPQ